MRLIDLHTHSLCSDGTLTPAQLVGHAMECNLTTIALTDHDTVRGLPKAISEGERLGVEVVSGIELSSYCGSEMHILGYFIDYQNDDFLQKLDALLKTRNERNRKMIELLNKSGYYITPKDIPNPDEKVVTRAHIAAALVRKGYADSVPMAIKLLLSSGEIGYIARERLSPETCISMINDAGGKAFLAHLNQIKLSEEKLTIALGKLKEMGLSGIEGYYSEYDSFWMKKCESYIKQFDFRVCGGSDYHGANKTIGMGCGYGNLRIPYSVLEQMRK